jgi:hypothetical protein
MKRLLLLAALAATTVYQTLAAPFPGSPLYVVFKETVLAGTAEKITIQTPSAGAKQVYFGTATIYCSVACDVTLTQNGTVATVTALTPTTVNISPPASALAFSGSDSTGGKTLDKYNIPTGGGTLVIDLSDLYLTTASGSNISLGTSAITGTARFAIRWQEK